MPIQLVNISKEEIFKRYSKSYNIYRDLYQSDITGLEIRDIPTSLAMSLRDMLHSKKELAYYTQTPKTDCSDFFTFGNFEMLSSFSTEIKSAGYEELGFKVSNVMLNYSDYDKTSFILNGKAITSKSSLVMGILNITPDSFSDGGKFNSIDSALIHVDEMVKAEVDIIDVGGESTRPGSDPVSEEEELDRVIPVIKKIKEKYPEIVISIDTTKSKVAEEAVKHGATIINDISGFTFDEKIVDVAAQYNVALVIMHIKGNPKDMQDAPYYDDVVKDVYSFLWNKTWIAKSKGVKSIIIDPGIGFGKRQKDNYEIINRLDEFKGIGYPILMGLSRKSLIGQTLQLPVDERDVPTVIAEGISIKNGAKIIRTHNVKNATYCKKMMQFINNPESLNNV